MTDPALVALGEVDHRRVPREALLVSGCCGSVLGGLYVTSVGLAVYREDRGRVVDGSGSLVRRQNSPSLWLVNAGGSCEVRCGKCGTWLTVTDDVQHVSRKGGRVVIDASASTD